MTLDTAGRTARATAALTCLLLCWQVHMLFGTVTLEGSLRLHQLLTHLYVLIPVLDNDKHYWVGDDEVEKLLKRGKDWLQTHPEREQLTYSYLKHRRDLARTAIARLTVEEES